MYRNIVLDLKQRAARNVKTKYFHVLKISFVQKHKKLKTISWNWQQRAENKDTWAKFLGSHNHYMTYFCYFNLYFCRSVPTIQGSEIWDNLENQPQSENLCSKSRHLFPAGVPREMCDNLSSLDSFVALALWGSWEFVLLIPVKTKQIIMLILLKKLN